MAFGDVKGTLQGSATSITNPLSATGSVTVAVGDLIFGGRFEQTSNTATTASDNLGNTYSAINAGSDAGTTTFRGYWSRVTVAGTLTSVNFAGTASSNNGVALAAVIEGPFQSSPLDANPANITNDNTTPYTCPATGTLAQADEVVVCWICHTGNVTLTATSPNNKTHQLNTATILTAALGRQTVAATTTVSPAWTASATPTDSCYGTASFKKDLTQSLTPSLYSDTDTFFAPTVTPGSVNLTPSLYNDADTFFAPTVSGVESAASSIPYASASALYRYRRVLSSEVITPPVRAAAQALTPALYNDTDTFFTPVVITTYSLTPGLFTDIDNFFSPTVETQYTVTPALFTDTDIFFSPIVGLQGDQNLTPSLFIDTDTFFAPTVAGETTEVPFSAYSGSSVIRARGKFIPPMSVTIVIRIPLDQDITPNPFVDTDIFFPPIVSLAGAQNVAPSLYVDPDTFFAPTVATTYTLTPSLYNDVDTFFSPIVELEGEDTINPPLFSDSDTFYAPTVGRGAVNVAPSLYSDTDAFFVPVITSVKPLLPPLFTDADTFHSPTVVPGAVNIAPGLVIDADMFLQPFVFQEGALGFSPSLYEDNDTFYSPKVKLTTRFRSAGRGRPQAVTTRTSSQTVVRRNDPRGTRRN